MKENYTSNMYTDNGGSAVHSITIFANPIYNVPQYAEIIIQPI